MSAVATVQRPRAIVYPDSDGKPMADNTKQFRYIVMIEGGLEAQYADDPNVFVGGDLLWYPVEGHPEISIAPDTLVVFGRPKGDRGSYKQWEEGGIAPQVVFEVLSPNNTTSEMVRKHRFYERHGVEEFYIYDPDRGRLEGFRREGGELREIPNMEGWVSPLLQIRFSLDDEELVLYHPDGQRFLTFVELQQQRDEALRQLEQHAKRAAAAEAEAARLRELLANLQQTPNGPSSS